MFREPKKRIESITPEQWQTQLSAEITLEVHNLIKREEKNFGVQFGDTVRMSVIAQFISTVVYEVLKTPLPETVREESSEATNIAHRRFADVREAVEHAVAAGFRGAMLTWSQQDKEFICQIMPEPEPANNQAC